jgi:predicted transposase/invertase (TIGR01784 family)
MESLLKNPWVEEGIKEGIKQGKEIELQEGKLEAKIETAKKLIHKGIDIKIIMEATGLSKKDLKKYNII